MNYTSIPVSEAKDLIENTTNLFILDVRTNFEFEDGHIYGAYLIPSTEITSRQNELPKNKSRPILVYCASGTRSSAVSITLDELFYEQVYNMGGGFSSWKDADYPYETGPFIKPNVTTSFTTISAYSNTTSVFVESTNLSSTNLIDKSSTSSTTSLTTPSFTFFIIISFLVFVLIKLRNSREDL
ncbi:MAG: rhodanese-like domain-containing protein [Candidatus Hodarchaeota archaeon]